MKYNNIKKYKKYYNNRVPGAAGGEGWVGGG